MFIISLTYKKGIEEVERFLAEHIKFLEKFYANGTFICSGRKNPRNGGIILAKATDKNEIEQLVKEDAFWQKDIAEYEIIEFEPTKFSEQFKAVINS